MEKIDFTEMDISRAIRYIAFPLIFATFFETLYNLVDMFWIGRLGYEQIAAVGIFGIFFEFVIIFNDLIGVGSVALIARNYGAKNFKRVNKVVKQTLFLKLFIAVIFCCVGILFIQNILVLLGAQGDTITYGMRYGRIISFGFIFMLSGYSLFTAMRGVGDSRTPMKIMIASNVLNMVLDPVFIFWLGLGIEGAAVATVLSQIVVFAAGIFLVTTKRHIVEIDSKIEFDFHTMKSILTIGIPSGIESFARNITSMITIRIIAGFSMAALAGFHIFFRLSGISWMFIWGLALACESLVGHNLGAGKPRRAEKTALRSGYMGTFITAGFAVMFFIYASHMVSIFNSAEEVIQVGTSCIRIISPFLLFFGFHVPLSGAFFGSGDTKPPMVITIVTSFCFQVPAMVILSHTLGVHGVFLAYGVAMLVGFCITFLWFSRGKWKEKKVE